VLVRNQKPPILASAASLRTSYLHGAVQEHMACGEIRQARPVRIYSPIHDSRPHESFFLGDAADVT